MSEKFSLNFQCAECDALVREWLNACRADLGEMRTRLLEVADSSERDPREMRDAWVSSLARMPDDEWETVMRAHYPRTAEALQKRLAHKIASGHPVDAVASAVFLGYRPLPARSK